MHLRTNFNALFTTLFAVAQTALTAAGSGDNTEVDGEGINRIPEDTPPYGSVTFLIHSKVTGLAGGDVLELHGTVQHSDDDVTYVDVDDELQPSGAADGLIATIEAEGEAVSEFHVPADGLKQYVRLQLKPDLTASGTDTATVTGLAILGGARATPV